MINRTRDSFQLARDDVLGDIAGHVDRIGTKPADHAVGDAEGR